MRPQRESSKQCMEGFKNMAKVSGDEEQEEEGEDEAGGSGVDSVEELLVSSGSEDEESAVPKPSSSKRPVMIRLCEKPPESLSPPPAELTIKRENGNTISIPVQHIEEGEEENQIVEDDSDIEVVEEVNRLKCTICQKSMENNQEYFKHLSETHFFTNLWGRFNKAEGPQRKTCPVKDCKKGFSTENKQEAAIHLGVHHNEVAQLLEERILKNASKARKTRRRYAPSARAMLMAGKTLTEGARIKNENTKIEELADQRDDEEIIKIEKQECMFCSTQFEVQRELRLHLFNHHLYSRMNSEVVKRGWLGIDTCPLCRKALDKHDMVEHWGLEHGGLDRAIDKCQGKTTSYVAMKSCNRSVKSWSRGKLRKLKVDIKVNHNVSAIARKLIEIKKKENDFLEEGISLAMDVESEEVDVYGPSLRNIFSFDNVEKANLKPDASDEDSSELSEDDDHESPDKAQADTENCKNKISEDEVETQKETEKANAVTEITMKDSCKIKSPSVQLEKLKQPKCVCQEDKSEPLNNSAIAAGQNTVIDEANDTDSFSPNDGNDNTDMVVEEKSPSANVSDTSSSKTDAAESRDPRLSAPESKDPRLCSLTSRDQRLGSPESRDPRLGSPASRDPRLSAPESKDPRLCSLASRDPRVSSPASRDPRIGSPASRDPRLGSPASGDQRQSSPVSRDRRPDSPASRDPHQSFSPASIPSRGESAVSGGSRSASPASASARDPRKRARPESRVMQIKKEETSRASASGLSSRQPTRRDNSASESDRDKGMSIMDILKEI